MRCFIKIWQIKIIKKYSNKWGEPLVEFNSDEYNLVWFDKQKPVARYNMSKNYIKEFTPIYREYFYYDSGSLAYRLYMLSNHMVSEYFLENGEKVSFCEYLKKKWDKI